MATSYHHLRVQVSESVSSQQHYRAALASLGQQQQSSGFDLGAETRMQRSDPSVVYPGFGPTRNTRFHASLLDPPQGHGWHASEEDGEEVDDGFEVDEGNVNDAGDDSDEDQGSGESDDSDQSDINDEDEENDSQTIWAGPNIGVDKLSARYCREVPRYFGEDHIETQSLPDREISKARLGSGTQEDETKFEQGLKRSRGETSDNDEVDGIRGRRSKRVRIEDESPLSSEHLFQAVHTDISKPQPSSWGEYSRYGRLASTSRRSGARAAGSAVQRLHNDRLRRPAPRATQGEVSILSYDTQSDLAIDDEDYIVHNVRKDFQQPPKFSEQGDGLGNGTFHTNTDQPQCELDLDRSQHGNVLASNNAYADARSPHLQPSSQPQQQPSSERHASSTQSQILRSLSEGGLSSSATALARSIGWHTPPHRAYQQATADTARDDPFFSDELFNGMLNGQPDNNHVGSIYICSQEQEIDEYHRRQLMPRPRHGQGSNAPVESRMSLSCFSVLDGVAQQGGGSELVIGDMDIAGWNAEWEAFVYGHDAEPLLRAHYLD